MATVRPFRALRYDQGKAGAPLSALICPPYDVIDPALQEALYRKSPYNVVRVELGKQFPGDAPGHDRYARGAETLATWSGEGILAQDAKPAFYLYEQTFDIASGGASRSQVVVRRGIFGAIKLEPFGTGCVYPHEETFGGPKADRLNLMRACAANMSPVFGLVPDETNVISGLLRVGVTLKAPDMELTQDNGVVERVWVLDDTGWCAALSDHLGTRKVFIADGHHRYETACNYRDERRKADNDPDGKLDKDYNYTLMVCVPMSDPGLYILPTHRLIQEAPGLSAEQFLRDAAALFEQRDASEAELLQLAEEQSGPVRFGVAFKDRGLKIITATPQAAEAMKRATAGLPSSAAPARSDAWRGLDVAVLQELVLKGMLRLSEEQVLRKEGISYTPDTRQALAKVTAPGSPYVMGFILRPTLIEQVRAVATAGEKMPQKSTYFYPKLLTGLVIRKL
ncbi:MAG: DUF1015 domain-containing protein [Planctomycetota bacterium]|nr:DUF1015 domain-containing protein [Planctomycetota bacterium]